MSNEIFVDASIVISILLKQPQHGVCLQELAKFDDAYISIITVQTVFYMAEKYKIGSTLAESLLANFFILDSNDSDYNFAITVYNGKDIEDALQIACAIRHQKKNFMTLDIGLEKKYRHLINVMTI